MSDPREWPLYEISVERFGDGRTFRELWIRVDPRDEGRGDVVVQLRAETPSDFNHWLHVWLGIPEWEPGRLGHRDFLPDYEIGGEA